MSDGEEDETIIKWCEWCGRQEGGVETGKFCGDSKGDSGQHSFIQREIVDATTAKQFKFACGTCPDAKAYGGARPHMKTSSGGKTCRNQACVKFKKPEVVKTEVKPTTPKPRSRPGRAPKHFIDHLRNLEKEAKRIKTEDLLPVELNIECVQYVPL